MASSIKFRRMYDALRRKGYSQAKSAAISNAWWNRKHGKGYRNLGHHR